MKPREWHAESSVVCDHRILVKGHLWTRPGCSVLRNVLWEMLTEPNSDSQRREWKPRKGKGLVQSHSCLVIEPGSPISLFRLFIYNTRLTSPQVPDRSHPVHRAPWDVSGQVRGVWLPGGVASCPRDWVHSFIPLIFLEPFLWDLWFGGAVNAVERSSHPFHPSL